MVSIASSRSRRVPAMTLVVRGSGLVEQRVVADLRLVAHPPVRRPRRVHRDHVHPGREPAVAVPGPDLPGDVDQRLLAGVLGVGACRAARRGTPPAPAAGWRRAAPPGRRRRPAVRAGPGRRSGPPRTASVRSRSSSPVLLPRGLQDNARVSMPSRLGRYAVRRRIGSGGFATVWLAYDEQLDSPVAVKVLADNWTEDHHVRRGSSRRDASCARSSRRTSCRSTTRASSTTAGPTS